MQPRTFVIVSILALTIAACGDRGVSAVHSEDDQAAQATNGFVQGKVAADALALESRVDGPAAYAPPGEPKPVGGDTASLPTMLIRTGQALVQVDSLEPAIAALEALARRSGGYVGNTAFMGGQENRRSAMLQIRVPSSRFHELQGGITSLGKVLSFNVNVQDVGEEYTDATARLKSKRQVEDRLLDLLRTRTGRLADVIELERALQAVREEIEATEGRLRYLRNQVGLSTMTVSLTEPGLQIAEPGYHPIRDAFGRAWTNFINLIAGLVASTGWLIPLLVMLWGAWRLVIRRKVRSAES